MSLSPDDALTAAHLIERLERLARAGAEAERLNPAQWNALRFIASANRFSRTPAALAEFLASTRGTISRTLMALEKNGYVSRDPSPTVSMPAFAQAPISLRPKKPPEPRTTTRSGLRG